MKQINKDRKEEIKGGKENGGKVRIFFSIHLVYYRIQWGEKGNKIRKPLLLNTLVCHLGLRTDQMLGRVNAKTDLEM